jgi:hypothetical protein
MRKKFVIFSLMLSLVIFAAACNLPKPNAYATESGDWINTAAAQTVQALSTQLAPLVTQQTVITNPGEITPSLTIQPDIVTQQPTDLPCDRAAFIEDVTIPDGTKLAPGEAFVKTWRLKNAGSCTWTTSYRLMFESGNAFSAPASINLPADVPPGGTTDISVQMKAPEVPKDYESNWKMQNSSGGIFGTGSTGSKAFWVRITVIEPTAVMFAITKVTITADNSNYSGTCPHTFNLSAEITSTREGKVTYYWERSNGTKTAVQMVEFSAPGKRTVNSTWEINASFDGWVKIYIDNPNHQYFPQFNLKANCSS